jgi:hypothetical protein
VVLKTQALEGVVLAAEATSSGLDHKEVVRVVTLELEGSLAQALVAPRTEALLRRTPRSRALLNMPKFSLRLRQTRWTLKLTSWVATLAARSGQDCQMKTSITCGQRKRQGSWRELTCHEHTDSTKRRQML